MLLALGLMLALPAPFPLPTGTTAREPVLLDQDWKAGYTLTFHTSPVEAARAEVSVTWTWAGGRGSQPDELELEISGGYGAFLQQLRTVGEEGESVEQDLRTGEDSFRVAVLEDGSASLTYVLPMDYDPDEGAGWDETPHVLADGQLWTGRALFVTAENASAEVRFVLPDDIHVSTSLEPLAAGKKFEPNAYRADSGSNLRETYFVVGQHFERTLEFDGSTVVLAVDGDAAPAAKLIEAQVRSFIESGIELFDGPPPARCLVAVTTAAHEGGGSVYGQDAHVLVNGVPLENGPTQWRRSLCHEIFHLWNPQRIGFASREMWFSEGFTNYYTHRLLAQRGTLSPDQFRLHVREWISAYRSQEEGTGLREAGNLGAKNNTLIYDGGALAALCLDIELRSASGNKRSLDTVMAGLYESYQKSDGPLQIEELERLLAKHGKKELHRFLERHVTNAEPLPLDEALALAGLQLEERTVNVPEMDALVHLLECSGMTTVSNGIEINRSEGSTLRPDDLLQEVAGRPVGNFGDLRSALAGCEPGEQVPVAVLRDGERLTLELRLGGRGMELPWSSSRQTELVPIPKAKKRVKAVREALFGKD